ncbi:MAG: zinc-binding dehydrogenase [Mycobacterium sp.]
MSYPTTCLAAVLTDFRKPVELRELPVPALEEDAILVRVSAATMCGTDVHIADGQLSGPALAKLPLILGHEIVGTVVALGPSRRTDSLGRPLAEGDLIAWSYSFCDRCYWCTVAKQPTLCDNRRMYGWGPADVSPGLTGGFAEYAYVMPRCRVVKVPPELDPKVAASATCALRTAVHAFESIGPLRPSDTVVIQGTGPVGLYATAYALAAGAGQVISIGAPAQRLAIARRWGADHVLDVASTTAAQRREAVLESTSGRGADVVVECAGVADAFSESLEMVRRGGKVAVVGASDPTPSMVSATNFNLRQIAVVGTVAADVSHYHRALEFLVRQRTRFDFNAILGERFDLDQVDAALDSVRGGAMKPTVAMG